MDDRLTRRANETLPAPQLFEGVSGKVMTEERDMLVPLIDEDLYKKLAELRGKMPYKGARNAARVFVPVGSAPPKERGNAPRILFVGRATRGFDEDHLASYEGAFEGAKDVFIRGLGGDMHSPFWAFSRWIIRDVLQKLEINATESELLSLCGWSNLAKIGDATGNPSDTSLNVQAGLCGEALRFEIAQFRPNAIVITARNYAQDEIILPVFGRDGWSLKTPTDDEVSYKLDSSARALVAWTNHPQNIGASGTLASVREFIADLIVKAWRGQDLPPSAA